MLFLIDLPVYLYHLFVYLCANACCGIKKCGGQRTACRSQYSLHVGERLSKSDESNQEGTKEEKGKRRGDEGERRGEG